MRRIIAISLAALIGVGPTTPAWANGRAVSLGSTGKTVSITAIPTSLGSQSSSLSFNKVGPLGMQSNLPSLVAPNLNTANPADPAISAPKTHKTESSIKTPAPTNRIGANPVFDTKITAAESALPIGKTVTQAISAAEKSPNGVAIVRAKIQGIQALRAATPQNLGSLTHADLTSTNFKALFDGGQNRADIETPDPAVDSKASAKTKKPRGSILRSIGRLLTAPIRLPKFKKKPKVDTEYTKDDFGGYKAIKPKALPENASRFRKFRASVGMHMGYGLKWGLNLFAIATILDTVVAPLITGVPWQLFLSESALSTFGRTELLTAFGPTQIAQAMMASPVAFLLLALPAAVLMEELRHRAMSFGGWFIGTALARPAASKLSSVLESIPDVSGLRSALQWILKRIENVSKRSFLIGAAISSFGFATAHVAMWGFHPYLILYHAVMGYALAHVAYRTRFIAAPFIAHFVFNAMTIGLATLVPAMLGVQGSAIASTVLGLGSVAYLYYNWRTWRKGKKAAELEARGETKKKKTGTDRRMRWYSRIAGLFMIPALLGGAFMASGPSSTEMTSGPVNAQYTQLIKDGKAAPNNALPKIHTPQAAQAQGHPAVPGNIGQILNQIMNGQQAATASPALTTVQIVQRNKASVVNVMTNGGTGTGFIINRDGTLITNAHVVAKSVNQATGKISREHKTQIVIRLANGQKVPAAVVAYNSDRDMAVLKIIPQNPFGWPTVTIGDSNTLLEGQEIVAMGYPLGQPFTVTKGIVSGLGHRGNGFIQFQQHDAAVNPGNSGGPLFNMQGEVVGINTQIVSPSGAFAGISRSITSQDLKNTLAQCQATGSISSPWLGAIFYPSDPVSDGFGAAVEAVRPDSPAALAGLQNGDIIVGVDGRGLPAHPLHAFGALSSVMRTKAPTDSLTLQVDRDGTVIDVVVTLGAH